MARSLSDKSEQLVKLPFFPLHFYDTQLSSILGYTARQYYDDSKLKKLNTQLKSAMGMEGIGSSESKEKIEKLRGDLGADMGRLEFELMGKKVYGGDLLAGIAKDEKYPQSINQNKESSPNLARLQEALRDSKPGLSEDDLTAIFMASSFVADEYSQGGCIAGVENFAWGQIFKDYNLMTRFKAEGLFFGIEKKVEGDEEVIYLTFRQKGLAFSNQESVGPVESQSTFTIKKNTDGGYEVAATEMIFFGTSELIGLLKKAQADFINRMPEIYGKEGSKDNFYDSIKMLIPALVDDEKLQKMFNNKVKKLPREAQEEIQRIIKKNGTWKDDSSPLKELFCKIYSTDDWSWRKFLSQPFNVGEMILAVFEAVSLQAFAGLASLWDTRNRPENKGLLNGHTLQLGFAFIVCAIAAPVYAAAFIGRQVLMRLTSPIRSFNEAYDYGRKLGGPVVGGLFAGVSTLVSIGLVVVASVFLAPVVSLALAKIGISSIAGPLAEGLAAKVGIVSAPSLEVAFSIGILAGLAEGAKYFYNKWRGSKQSAAKEVAVARKQEQPLVSEANSIDPTAQGKRINQLLQGKNQKEPTGLVKESTNQTSPSIDTPLISQKNTRLEEQKQEEPEREPSISLRRGRYGSGSGTT